MTDIAKQECEACRVGAPLVTKDEKEVLMPQIPLWTIVEVDQIEQLHRVFSFSDFIAAQKFTNLVADLAEVNTHHPAILLEWGKVSVSWWTHKIKGLHKNDFVMAAKTDQLFLQTT